MRTDKEPHVYVAFDTTADAMACKAAFGSAGIEGRLVSVPREISAGCGYAWRSPARLRQAIEQALADDPSFDYAGIWEL